MAYAGIRTGMGWVRWVRARLTGRPDTEHVMSLNRAAFCILMALYVVLSGEHEPWTGPSLLATGLLITIGLFAHILLSPAPNAVRRLIALTADLATICFVLHIGGEPAAIFYPLILWTIIGNGLRFGIGSFRLAALVGLIGFGAVVATTPFWWENLALATGLLVGQVSLPLYAGALVSSLSRAKAKAEAANRAKDLFLASVSHELRTPLQAIIGTGDLLASTRLASDQADMTRTIMSSSNALLSMIDGLLQFSRIEAGSIDKKEVEFDVLDLLDEVRCIVWPTCQPKALRLALYLDPGILPRIIADRRHIRDVLLNLAGNAAKFTDTGGILLSVAPAPSNRTGSGPHLVFEVVDTGIGVAPDAQARIWERFVQADPQIADRYGGTGLGLALCRRLVEAIGGEIGLRSVPGKGSTFWFRIPVAPGTGSPGVAAPYGTGFIVTLPNDQVKGRLHHHFGVHGVAAEWPTPASMTVAQTLEAAVGNGRCVVMQTPSTLMGLGELNVAVQRLEGGKPLPLMLVDGPVLVGADADLRWLAPIRLPERFTDGELQVALDFVSRLKHLRSPIRGGSSADSTPSRRSQHILLADDNRTNQMVLAKMLEAGGHTVRIVSDGEEALDALERETFDLVLLDVNMPKLNGIEAAKLQRVAELGLRRVPIIGLTADASPQRAIECREAGMDDAVTKPIDAQALLAAIDRVSAHRIEKTDSGRGRAAIEELFWEKAEVINPQYLADLARLGGQPFVIEVASEFMRDAAEVIRDMIAALDEGDATKFQFSAHALGSMAGNVGAVRLNKLGLHLERMTPQGIVSEGRAMVRHLLHELDQFVNAVGSAGGGTDGVGP